MPKNNTKLKKQVFPNYTAKDLTNGAIHGALLKYKQATFADATDAIRAEVEMLRARADVRFNNAVAKVGEKL